MTALSARRRLLVAEANLHRVRLADEWRDLHRRTDAAARRTAVAARSAAGWAVAGVGVLAALRGLGRRSRRRAARPPRGLLGRAFALARFGVSAWLALRPVVRPR
jgi:hypothetical protein